MNKLNLKYIIFLYFLIFVSCEEDVLVRDNTGNSTDLEKNFYVDTFSQEGKSLQVDILWMIDSSGSMYDQQNHLAEQFSSFIQNIVGTAIDYHIGVVPSDLGLAGQLSGGYIDKITQDSINIFSQNVRVGTYGDAEELFEATMMALGKDGHTLPLENQRFLRGGDVPLYIIMVSDDEEKSEQSFEHYLRLFKDNEPPITISAIAVDITNGSYGNCPNGDSYASPGYRYKDMALETGGVFISICDDFSESLSLLSLDAISSYREFSLTHPVNINKPITCFRGIEDFICIDIDDNCASGENCANYENFPRSVGDMQNWFYDSSLNAVIFEPEVLPSANSNVKIYYSK